MAFLARALLAHARPFVFRFSLFSFLCVIDCILLHVNLFFSRLRVSCLFFCLFFFLFCSASFLSDNNNKWIYGCRLWTFNICLWLSIDMHTATHRRHLFLLFDLCCCEQKQTLNVFSPQGQLNNNNKIIKPPKEKERKTKEKRWGARCVAASAVAHTYVYVARGIFTRDGESRQQQQQQQQKSDTIHLNVWLTRHDLPLFCFSVFGCCLNRNGCIANNSSQKEQVQLQTMPHSDNYVAQRQLSRLHQQQRCNISSPLISFWLFNTTKH